jgi:hypothetical protein
MKTVTAKGASWVYVAPKPPVIARSEATKQSILAGWQWIASRSLSSGARSRDPLARNDEPEALESALKHSRLIDANASAMVEL